ncbi:ribonuclease T1 [Arthrobacter ulcerisalmonis]|uniref:ribonuclease domain-containing protein n=1 Tax=Arthrobacter sp. B1I2 TaxID=3042263 RepID=UPI00277E4962|nr:MULTISPECIES: ribonuclease domain-containing protein [Arthrobacter]MDQ0661509.1 ribonuclease T1 [Arthrobacter ulcerisalmonis]MDQ0729423.1 ribonuclease T1 [Arthrobacter sp. B1I2]
MRNRSILPLLLAALVVLAMVAFGGAGLLGQQTESTTPGTASSRTATPDGTATSAAAKQSSPQRRTNPSSLPEIRESALPADGRRVLGLIRAGGPFQFSQDDQVFGNFERVLPVRDRGYYREYTVPTPGESDRGARRIVAGNGGEKYYTGDHYETFKYIAEGS